MPVIFFSSWGFRIIFLKQDCRKWIIRVFFGLKTSYFSLILESFSSTYRTWLAFFFSFSNLKMSFYDCLDFMVLLKSHNSDLVLLFKIHCLFPLVPNMLSVFCFHILIMICSRYPPSTSRDLTFILRDRTNLIGRRIRGWVSESNEGLNHMYPGCVVKS